MRQAQLLPGGLNIHNTSFVNNGTLTVGAGGITSTGGSFGNYGPLNNSGPLVVDGGSFVNTSVLTTGDFTLMGNITGQNTNNGTINAQKITLSNTGLPLTNDWATINAHGGIDVSTSTLNPCMGLGTITYWGTLNQSGTCKVTATNALPVVLTDFGASMAGNAVELSWHTASEVNSAYFDIEHSMDGLHFGTIGERTAAGTTSTDQFYSFVHERPDLGLNYYRLLQVDNDGESELSNVVSIMIRGEWDVPKSVILRRGTVLEIENIADTDELVLTNVQGARFAVKIAGQTAYIATQVLSTGTYFLTVNRGAEVQNSTIIIIE